mmetsp:Transcript_62148/g.176565  ORF Transcript_62148/g.176565 Transcript_62148/m.176565 type:complete len:274 (+) Transcript_62148:523-1344(+)
MPPAYFCMAWNLACSTASLSISLTRCAQHLRSLLFVACMTLWNWASVRIRSGVSSLRGSRTTSASSLIFPVSEYPSGQYRPSSLSSLTSRSQPSDCGISNTSVPFSIAGCIHEECFMDQNGNTPGPDTLNHLGLCLQEVNSSCEAYSIFTFRAHRLIISIIVSLPRLLISSGPCEGLCWYERHHSPVAISSAATPCSAVASSTARTCGVERRSIMSATVLLCEYECREYLKERSTSCSLRQGLITTPLTVSSALVTVLRLTSTPHFAGTAPYL